MCLGIAVPIYDLPEAIIARYGLGERIVQRDPDASREVQFLLRHRQPVLPIQLDNQLRIVEWGNAVGSVRCPTPAGVTRNGLKRACGRTSAPARCRFRPRWH